MTPARPPSRLARDGPKRIGLSESASEAARLAAWVLGLEALLGGLGSLLAQHRGGSLAVQAFVAEWGVGRLGVSWSDPEATPPGRGVVVRRAAIGMLLGVTAAGVTLAFAAVTRAVVIRVAAFSSIPSSVPASLLVGLFTATLLAVRDELVLRGLVLRAFRHTLSPAARIVACALVAGAARAGQPDGPSLSLAATFTTGAGLGPVLLASFGAACFALLWVRERGAWAASGAHTAWAWVTTSLLPGAPFDVRWAPTAWGGGGVGGYDASLAVVCALALITGVASLATARSARRRPGRQAAPSPTTLGRRE